MLPDVNVKKLRGGLGRQKPTNDGVSALIIQGTAVLGTLELGKAYELRSLAAAVALGITAATMPVPYRQISEFYRLSPGAILFLMVVGRDVTLAEMADRTLPYAKKLLRAQNGRVKQLGLCLNPAPGYTPVLAGGMDSDVLAAVQKAQALAAEEFEQHRPVFVAIGAHGLTGSAADATDLKTQAAEYVSVVAAADHLLSPTEPAVGTLLGIISAAQVHLNIGWVNDDFQLMGDGSFLQAGLSTGVANEDLPEGELGAYHDKGYIVALQHPGADGFFFSDSPTCTADDSDFSTIENVRTVNKAATLIRAALLPQLKGPLRLNADGTLQAQVLNELEQRGRSGIEVQMARTGEISALDVYIDPEQQVLSGSTLEVKFSVVPVGVARHIEATVGLTTAL